MNTDSYSYIIPFKIISRWCMMNAACLSRGGLHAEENNTPSDLRRPGDSRHFSRSCAELKRSIASRVQLNYRCCHELCRAELIVIQPAPLRCEPSAGLKNPGALPCVKNFTAESPPIRSRYATLRATGTNSVFLRRITVTVLRGCARGQLTL
jgi:hypothetical protein